MAEKAHHIDYLEGWLEGTLDAILSRRRSATEPALKLATLSRRQQDFTLHWVSVVTKTNAELGYQLALYAEQAFNRMDEQGAEAWIVHAMDAYDRQGLLAAIKVLQGVEGFADELKIRASGLLLEEICGVLENFIHGLNGRQLSLQSAEHSATDTETLFLPQLISRFSSREDNFRLYKAMAVHQWAQCWYGTWRVDAQGQCSAVSALMRQREATEQSWRLFHALETERLNARIARDFPGLYRDMQQLQQELHETPACHAWQALVRPLRNPETGWRDSLALLERAELQRAPDAHCYQGDIRPDLIDSRLQLRLAEEKKQFRIALARLAHEQQADQNEEQAGSEEEALTMQGTEFQARKVADPNAVDGNRFELLLDGKPIAPPDDLRGVMQSILQDFGRLPEDYLYAAGPGAYLVMQGDADDDTANPWAGVYHEEGASFYDEWDNLRQHYRKNWCVLRELEVAPQWDDFPTQTLQKYAGLVKSLRRTFEVLRGEDRILRRQNYGEDIDLDALVEAWADVSAGMEMSEHLFTRLHKEERHIAVMFMVDMSGSTRGWINEAEREALLLLAESLETLGDRYAIYGFSGTTRKRCELYRIKTFEERYTPEVKARISGIQPKDYTRMGPAIRHLSQMLGEVEARIKLLITLSDGKPDDYDPYYRGAYGIDDTRMALFEARRSGIHPYCITIDEQGQEYLPHMYGAGNFAVIDDVRKLPLKVSDIYRRLTS